ncbi:MAG TPA: SMP-30/gluconolactonase/LRE family protein [Jatrophihabitans sp.]|nr:SMP-30/gluconolactonase/LRE family protein [Jatrophihabitans sp.]
MTNVIKAEVALDCAHGLGESALWDARRQLFRWVDIPTGTLHSLDLGSGEHRSTVLDDLISNVVLAEDGTLVVANRREVYRYDEASGERQVLWTVDEGGSTRLNDGAADPAGRLLIGTLAYDNVSAVGGLYSLDHSDTGGSRQRRLLPGVTTSNGLGWTVDGSRFYHVDSPTRLLRSYDYDVETGDISYRGVLAEIKIGDAVPDGLIVDGDDCVWVALWGGAAVHRYTPAGVLDTVVDVGATYVTSCAFAGSDRDTLVITTARDSGDPGTAPDAHGGALFAVRPGVAAQAERVVSLPGARHR